MVCRAAARSCSVNPKASRQILQSDERNLRNVAVGRSRTSFLGNQLFALVWHPWPQPLGQRVLSIS